MGTDFMWWFDIPVEPLMDMIKGIGANYWRQAMICGDTDWWLNQMTGLKQSLDKKGLRLIVGTHGYDEWDPFFCSAFATKAQACAAIIMNTDGWGDRWIQRWGRVVETIQPYGIDVLNEMFDKTGTPYENIMTNAQYLEAYRQFCIRAIDSWRTIKPDIVCLISGCPFMDMRPIANNPIPRPNLIYVYHYYYLFDGTLSQWASNFDKAYYQGNLSQAKSLLTDYLMNGKGAFATFKTKGLPILFEEMGTIAQEKNNNFQFVRDVNEICKANNVSVEQFCLAPFGTGSHQATTGMLTPDWSQFNSYGQLWKSCLASG
jgi:hypothetical protein